MTEIEELRARIDALEADNAVLRRAMDDLAVDLPVVDTRSSSEPGRPVSRRRLLGAGVGAVAAGVAAVVAVPGVASAHDVDDVRYGADNPAVTKRTLLVIANGSTADAFVALTRNTGAGVVGQSTAGGTGVEGYAGDGAPPDTGSGSGVVGIAVGGNRPGVYGQGATGVYGEGAPGVSGLSLAGFGVVASSIYGTGLRAYGKSLAIKAETSGDFATAIKTFGNNLVGVDASGTTAVLASGSTATGGVGVVATGNVGVNASGDVTGVAGESTTPKGHGVFGHSTSSSSGTGVHGLAEAPTGVGVRGVAGHGGQGNSYGTGVIGTSGNGANAFTFRPNTGVVGVGYGGTGSGVYGTGQRGAVFQGTAAPLQLVANQQNTHPDSGQLGDLFVDITGRLWFCKGDTNWVKVA